MKKSLVLVLIVLLASSALYADVSVGAWGRIITSVYGMTIDGESGDPMVDMLPNWNPGAASGRVGFKIIGSAEDIGFELDVDGDMGDNFYAASMSVGEFMYIWAKPMDIIKVDAGKFQIDTLRGKFGGKSGAGTHYVQNGSGDMEDAIFARMRTGHGIGVEVTPVEGATLQAVLSMGVDGTEGLLEDATKTIQIGGGYNIEGVGLIRAQYIGENAWGGAVASQDVGVAFAYMGMEGLLVDAGVTIDISDVDIMPNKTSVALGASYSISDAIKATLCAQVNLGQDIAEESTTRIALHLLGTYALDGGLTANLEGALLTGPTQTDVVSGLNEMAFNVYPYVRKNLANGYTSIGFKFESSTLSADGMDDLTASMWSLPIVLEYWF